MRCLVVQYISIIGSFYHPDGLFDHNFHLTSAVVGIKSVGWCTSDWMEWWWLLQVVSWCQGVCTMVHCPVTAP